MTSKKYDNWLEFVRNHEDQKDLMEHMDSISKKLDVSNDTSENFKFLSSSPSSVLLNFNSMSNEIVPSFFHSTIGNKLLGDKKATMFGLSGFNSIATPIQFGDSMFSAFKTEKASPPDLFEILEFGVDASNSDKGRSTFNRFALLPVPFLEPLLGEDMSPPAVLSRVSLFHEEKSSEFKQQFTKKLKKDVLEANQDQPLSAEELEAVISVEKTDDLHRAAFEDFFLFIYKFLHVFFISFFIRFQSNRTAIQIG